MIPGIPPLADPSQTGRLIATTAQGAMLRLFAGQTRWGIYTQSGRSIFGTSGLLGQVLNAVGIGPTLSTNAVEFSKETKVSDFPVQSGGFASYNKVEMPATPTVTLTFSGTESERAAFLDTIDAACKLTTPYDVVTPEVTYVGYQLERYSYQRRNTQGATLLRVEIGLKEVREVSAAYAKVTPKDPSAAEQKDAGKVQGKEPRKSILNKVLTP